MTDTAIAQELREMSNTGEQMSKLIPTAGMLFYAEPTFHLIEPQMQCGTQVLSTSTRKDRSYSEHVLRCLASDDAMVVAEVAWGYSFGSNQRLLKLSDYRFKPVGPDVAKALGLSMENERQS